MRTERQIEASRANGARSRGPVTAEGKHNSSRNAIKHGLLAETIVLKTERSDRFLGVLAELEEELQPATSIEYTLIEKMAAARWRQLRLWGMEKAAMEYQTRQQTYSVGVGEDIPTRASLAFATLGEARSMDLIIRYDSLCDRQYLRAHRRFMEMRRDRGISRTPSESTPETGVMPQAETPDSKTQGPPDAAPQSGGTCPSSRESAAMTCVCFTNDMISPAAGDSFLPEPSEKIEEKQPNEPSNSLQTKQPPDAELAGSREPHDTRKSGHQGRTTPPVPAPSSTPFSPEKQPGELKTTLDLTGSGCKIDGSCPPLNPQDSR
jgi:hypothetical protein